MKKEQKIALITGVTGQDGAYLAEFLLNKGYIVHGITQADAWGNFRHAQNYPRACAYKAWS